MAGIRILCKNNKQIKTDLCTVFLIDKPLLRYKM